jgi:hypothetical protein
MRTHRLIWLAAIGLLTLALAQCGGGSSTPTSPSPSPSPSPTPTPTPSPTPGGGGSLSISPQTIQSQGQPQATVTLASAAPDGGALVRVSSNDTSTARVPASVTVPAGSRSTTFLIDTSTVLTPTTVVITATYGSASMSATLTVSPGGTGTLGPSFVVRSRTRGTGACAVDTETKELDCVLDASASQGGVSAYLWTYTMGSTTLRHTAPASNPASSTQGTGCPFYQQGTGGDGPGGDRFLNMTVTLQLRDANGTLSGIAQQAVKVYPNMQCGFSY